MSCRGGSFGCPRSWRHRNRAWQSCHEVLPLCAPCGTLACEVERSCMLPSHGPCEVGVPAAMSELSLAPLQTATKQSLRCPMVAVFQATSSSTRLPASQPLNAHHFRRVPSTKCAVRLFRAIESVPRRWFSWSQGSGALVRPHEALPSSPPPAGSPSWTPPDICARAAPGLSQPHHHHRVFVCMRLCFVVELTERWFPTLSRPGDDGGALDQGNRSGAHGQDSGQSLVHASENLEAGSRCGLGVSSSRRRWGM